MFGLVASAFALALLLVSPNPPFRPQLAHKLHSPDILILNHTRP
jgi:hypothetical protein